MKSQTSKQFKVKRECPCCGWKGEKFLPSPYSVRDEAMCPKCGSLERYRFYYLYLKKIIPKDKKLKVLHFAPEAVIEKLFRSYGNIKYVSADINPEAGMVKEDITDLSFNNDQFDIIFCSHVLEHVEADRKAMKELYRVLKPGGFAILLVPIFDVFKGKKLTKTFEDKTVTDPKKREKVFGEKDHVRVYTRDFKDRLEDAGFKVKIEKFIDSFSDEAKEKYVLMPELNNGDRSEANGWIYYCEK